METRHHRIHVIAAYTLSLYTIHFTQPLDVRLLGPLAHYYSQGLDEFPRVGNLGLGKKDFEPLLYQARLFAYTV